MRLFNSIFRILSTLILISVVEIALAQESVLRSGAWYKLGVEKNGVYKIDYNFLKKMGIDPNKINPQKIKLYGNGGGMLPQQNSATRPVDLIEHSIFVSGEEDGKFNKEDYILFYGEGPSETHFDSKRGIFFYEKNLYDNLNYCFLTLSETNGKRLISVENLGTGFPIVNEFDDYLYHELDNTNELKSGREWFGENFTINPEQSFRIDLSAILPNSEIKIVSDVMGQSYLGSTFKLFFNSNAIGEQYIPSIFNSQYSLKGRHKRDTLIFNSSAVSINENADQEIKYQYNKSAGYSIGYLDYFLITCKRKLALHSDQVIFTSSASLQNQISEYEITSLPEKFTIWDITNSFEPAVQSFSSSGNTARFGAPSISLHEFIVFNTSIPSPKFIKQLTNQNLHGQSTPNLVIISHPDFMSEATRLANHRQTQNGLSTLVVSTEEVFNEFSSGRTDITALRDFTKYLYDKNSSALKSLLLFGRGSYDYKGRLYYNTNFVPVYESRNSLEPLETYSSDDFYGFLENAEGEWTEDPPQYHTLDIGVGRLPVKTVQEASTVVDKLIDYDINVKNFGDWRKKIVFIADDGDGNTHQNQSDKLAQKIETTFPDFNAQRIFIDAFPQELKPGGEFSPGTNKTIQQAIDRGAVIINYTGHGGEKLWAQERIFDNLIIDKLDNKTYPLFVTATCEFGRNDNPADISGAELCILKNKGGAIGMVTTARPVNSSTNFELNQAFYAALFTREANSFLSLGEIFRRTKNNSMSGVANRNFSLLGDPSMKLAFPSYKMVVNEIKNEQGDDSLKALSTIVVTGQVETLTGGVMTSFNGVVDATLFDKKVSFTTLGNENPPFSYKEWYNSIFRGSASIKEGLFELKFIVPKNIAYQVGQGKLSLYAHTDKPWQDAMGMSVDFIVGKSNLDPVLDTTPPRINLFMGDETFINEGTISSDSYLVATLQDDSGINISGYGIGNSIIGVLDNAETFILNDYYSANEDDFTNGKIRYRIKGLAQGEHTIKVKAWDTHNNPSEAIITFYVSGKNSIIIENFGNFPNPFTQNTTLFFTHNHGGDDLEATIAIYDLAGQLVKTSQFSISSSPYKVELPVLDVSFNSDKNLVPGLYLTKLIVRSLSDGSKNERVTKLIILN